MIEQMYETFTDAAVIEEMGQATRAGAAPLTRVDVSDPRPDADRTHTMPMRERTRDEDRQSRITDERQRRIQLNAERDHQAWLYDRAHPPPF